MIDDWTKFAEGLKLLATYVPLDKQYLAAEHDIIYVCSSEDAEGAGLTEVDKRKLDHLGFHVDSDSNCWSFYV